jgi:MFS superfamily sulfate permease-like transporter
MKKQTLLTVLWFLCMSTFVVLAQAPETPVAPAMDRSQLWDYAIAIVSPIIVWGINKIIPNVPKLLLPTITPLVGIGLGYALNYMVGLNMSVIDMAKAGALAVFIREVTNQALKATGAIESDPPAATRSRR